MKIRNSWLALVLAAPLLFAAACGRDADDRSALEADERRELDLVLSGNDSAQAVFQDSAVGIEAIPGPAAPPLAAPAPPPSRDPRRPPPPARRAPPPPVQPAPAPAPAPEPRLSTLSVPTGTTFGVRLNQELSTQTNSVGDPFTATLSEPIRAADGSTLVPAGATVRGRVTAVNKSDNVSETAVIKLAFESISFGGRSYPLQAAVVQTEPQKRTRQTTGQQAAKVAAGAAAGAIIGKVLGNSSGATLKGAVAGAAAGTAVAMGTADVDVVLPAGSNMVIRLDAPIEVRRS